MLANNDPNRPVPFVVYGKWPPIHDQSIPLILNNKYLDKNLTKKNSAPFHEYFDSVNVMRLDPNRWQFVWHLVETTMAATKTTTTTMTMALAAMNRSQILNCHLNLHLADNNRRLRQLRRQRNLATIHGMTVSVLTFYLNCLKMIEWCWWWRHRHVVTAHRYRESHSHDKISTMDTMHRCVRHRKRPAT